MNMKSRIFAKNIITKDIISIAIGLALGFAIVIVIFSDFLGISSFISYTILGIKSIGS